MSASQRRTAAESAGKLKSLGVRAVGDSRSMSTSGQSSRRRRRRFGAIVDGAAETRHPLIVERVLSRSAGGVRWSAGTAALGAPLP